MAFVFALLFVLLHLLSPAEIFPSLGPFRVLLILAVIAGILCIPVIIQSYVIGRLRTQVLLLVAFFLWVAGSWVFHGWFGGVLFTAENLAPSFVVYFIAIVQFHTPFRLRLLSLGLLLVALYIFGMAVSEIPQARATGLPTPYVMAGGDEMSVTEVRIRGLGMLHDPNFYGQYILIILPLLFVSNKPKGGWGVSHLFALMVTPVLIAGIYLTSSRGAQLGLLLLVGFVLWKRYRLFGAIAALLLSPVAILALNATRSRAISIEGGIDRLQLWSDGLGMFKSSPIWGIGYYKFADRELLTAHNTYLLCFAEMGTHRFSDLDEPDRRNYPAPAARAGRHRRRGSGSGTLGRGYQAISLRLSVYELLPFTAV